MATRRTFLLTTTAFLTSCAQNLKRRPSSIVDYFFPSSQNNSLSIKGIKNLKDEYDLLIIGSGYGASVVAQRMSEEYPNASICVLERGKEFNPGDFPKKITDMATAVRSSVNPNGLIDQTLGKDDEGDLDIISANGLGGTSLINAAIAIRPTRAVLLQDEWPKEIREDVEKHSIHALGGLEDYYRRAERKLESRANQADIEQTTKSSIFGKAVKKLKVNVGFLTLNIKYTDKSQYSVDRGDCTMCGDCCSGCNVGAKNILPYNYLYQAQANGCEIFTNAEVENISKTSFGYEVKVVDPTTMKLMNKVVRAKNVVLGAGSRGSTSILLKSQKNGLKLSKVLGTRLSLNADVMGFCYNGNAITNSVGTGVSKRKFFAQGKVGPGISTYGNYRELNKDKNLEKQFLLLEGSIPSPIAGFVATALARYSIHNKDKISFSKAQWDRVEKDKGLSVDSSKLEVDGALNYSTLFLACGHDASAGRYVLDKNDKIKVIYKDVIKEEFYSVITDRMKAVSNELGGLYLDNPRTSIFKDKMMATHPLGGCPMGDSHRTGVVNHKGQVFSDDGNLYEGFYVVDASIIPRSLGATPLLTITALAERISDKMIQDNIL
ncbi:GMC family oxidoreductase N-terminal domain-containing protein [Bacteriovorax sp. Seq25_V]|uniref:GMC family oxidoreductase N-terminal domain-containing protein n=1 Tax=Bacteriovorax sp. Seq25_V TaxID=1201288 RepID=UPI000389E9CD|nr:GMC family oxidoreductase N-terminal domain-containing protein [Bacteriovorax sp. Seq25_V]EQC44861.1 GMC oxidoreductase [Bacteriovorax sp. Seq25_V]